MISDQEIIARFNAVEASLGGLYDKQGNITTPRCFAQVAADMGVTQKRVADVMSAWWRASPG